MKKRLVLASSSPRRQTLFKLITEDFDILAMDVDERTMLTDPIAVVELLAEKKAGAAANAVQNPSIVLGADTIVVLDGQILGKPADAEDAARMLKQLSDRGHDVYTGYCLIDTETGKQYTAHVRTEVDFYSMTDSEIVEYIQTGEPMDKAGAYGIQGYGAKFIRAIQGDYYCVMGFPVSEIYHVLQDFMD